MIAALASLLSAIAGGVVALAPSGDGVALPTPVRLTADVDDAYALRTNPGGLGLLRGGELRLVYGRTLPTATLDNLGPDAVNGLGLFGAARVFDLLTLAGAFEISIPTSGRASERTSLGLAFGGTKSGLGVALEHVNAAGSEAKNVLASGLTIRPTSWLSAAVQIHDVGQTAGPRQYDVGLAFRPFSDRVLLSTRWRTLQGNDIFGDNLDLAGRVDVEPIDGLFVGGGVNLLKAKVASETTTEVGAIATLALALEQVLVGTSFQDTRRANELAAEIAFRSRPRPSILARSRVAVIDLEGELVPSPSIDLLTQSFKVTAYGGVPILLDQISKNRQDEGVFLRIAPLSIGWAKAHELRRAIAAIRETGRRVDCELTGANDLEYFIASSCTSIMIPPALTLEINGLAKNVLFFGDALDRFGVKVDYVARGKYKSFPEQFTRSNMSEAEREALSAYVDRLFDVERDAIAQDRNLERAKVDEVIAHGVVTSSEAKTMKLVDAVVYPDEVEAHLGRLYGRPVSFAGPTEAEAAIRPHWAPYPRIAIVNIDAAITGGESRNLPFELGESSGAQTIVGALEAARLDPRIRAVVLRVDSPGGDAVASDLIARAVKLLDKQKPVIASFGDVAASGGYYVAAPARVIYAEPTTLTGSIGVFSLKVSFQGLIEKLGVSNDTIERGAVSNSQSPWSELKPEERAAMEKEVDDIYARFLEVVSVGRRKTIEEIRAIAEGRIWSGEDAKKNGLVDELGGLNEAIRRAKREASLEVDAPIELVTLPSTRQPLPGFVRTGVQALLGAPESRMPLGDVLPHAFKRAAGALIDQSRNGARPLALAPFVLDID
jgi:protease IV